jgi:lipoprotein-anchoring transpeptidase ErfK/SrfK
MWMMRLHRIIRTGLQRGFSFLHRLGNLRRVGSLRSSSGWRSSQGLRSSGSPRGSWFRFGRLRRFVRLVLSRFPGLHMSPRWLRVWLGAAGLALGVAALLPVVTGRTSPRGFRLDSAKQAVSLAQQANASRWCPGALHLAEGALHAGVVEHRHQETRFYLFRDFTAAELTLADAESKARAAAGEAMRKRRDARNASRSAIDQAAEALGRTDAFAQALNLRPSDRALLQGSKIALTEAKLLHAEGEFESAGRRASLAGIEANRVTDRAATQVARFADAGQIQGWRSWIDDTVTWSRRTGAHAIVVFKDRHQLTLYDDGRPFRTYTVELGYNAVNDKFRSGDGATPEGRYHITAKKGPGMSTYYKALLLNYPNEEDRASVQHARRAGSVPRWIPLGGLIEIHGEGGRGKDWTNGCVALVNEDMDDLFSKVEVGTPVTIVGGDGNGTFTKLVSMHRAAPGAKVD